MARVKIRTITSNLVRITMDNEVNVKAKAKAKAKVKVKAKDKVKVATTTKTISNNSNLLSMVIKATTLNLSRRSSLISD